MTNRTRPIPLLLLLAACGGGGGDDSSDAGVDGGTQPDAQPVACSEFTTPAGTISEYPGSFSGDLVGAGADLFAPQGRCTDERDYYAPEGEDQVVALTGLTPGTLYGVILDSGADMSFYVATDCADGEPVAGECLVIVDTEIGGGEVAEFTAPASGTAYLVIDNFDPGLPAGEGEYMIEVVPADCVDDGGCTTSAVGSRCFRYSCVECVTAFDCDDSGAPACSADNACVASLDECTDDDVAEPDDGPTDATVLAVPTDGNPTVANQAICSSPAGESDWFSLELLADTELGFTVGWDAGAGADIDLIIWDELGEFVDGGLSFGTVSEAFRVELTAGTYYIEVDYYDPPGQTAAVDYTLTALIPECEDSFDCDVAADPVCTAAGSCGDGPAQCTGDDAADAAGGDDGPAAARSLAGGVGNAVTLSDGLVCNVPGAEADWYLATTNAIGQGLTIDLTWTGTDVDLDLVVFDDQGRALGLAFYGTEEEHVTLTRLPIGTYYIQVTRFAEDAEPAAVAYSVTSTRTAADACDMDSDCDDEFATQVFRGDCDTGACVFIEGAGALANGATCDSGDDCTSARCSYILFEADAADSVCTTTCTTTANCSALSGTTCTTGLSTNFCVPSCGDDLECGALTGSATIDSGQPWDYGTCTTGTCGF